MKVRTISNALLMLNLEKESFVGNIVLKLSFQIALMSVKNLVSNKLARQNISLLYQFRFLLFWLTVIIIYILILFIIITIDFIILLSFPMNTYPSIRHRFDVEIPRGKFVEITSILKDESTWKLRHRFDVDISTWIRLSKSTRCFHSIIF